MYNQNYDDTWWCHEKFVFRHKMCDVFNRQTIIACFIIECHRSSNFWIRVDSRNRRSWTRKFKLRHFEFIHWQKNSKQIDYRSHQTRRTRNRWFENQNVNRFWYHMFRKNDNRFKKKLYYRQLWFNDFNHIHVDDFSNQSNFSI